MRTVGFHGFADPEGAVLLVRGALAEGDSERAANLADATRRLAATTPDHPDMAAAADHARGLVEQDAAHSWSGGGPLLGYRCPRYRAGGCRPLLGRPGRPAQRGGHAAAGV